MNKELGKDKAAKDRIKRVTVRCKSLPPLCIRYDSFVSEVSLSKFRASKKDSNIRASGICDLGKEMKDTWRVNRREKAIFVR